MQIDNTAESVRNKFHNVNRSAKAKNRPVAMWLKQAQLGFAPNIRNSVGFFFVFYLKFKFRNFVFWPAWSGANYHLVVRMKIDAWL